jgi:hypothetical protein
MEGVGSRATFANRRLLDDRQSEFSAWGHGWDDRRVFRGFPSSGKLDCDATVSRWASKAVRRGG